MGYNIKKFKLELKRSNPNNFNFECRRMKSVKEYNYGR